MLYFLGQLWRKLFNTRVFVSIFHKRITHALKLWESCWGRCFVLLFNRRDNSELIKYCTRFYCLQRAWNGNSSQPIMHPIWGDSFLQFASEQSEREMRIKVALVGMNCDNASERSSFACAPPMPRVQLFCHRSQLSLPPAGEEAQRTQTCNCRVWHH